LVIYDCIVCTPSLNGFSVASNCDLVLQDRVLLTDCTCDCQLVLSVETQFIIIIDTIAYLTVFLTSCHVCSLFCAKV